MVDRVIRQLQFARQRRRRLPLADAPQQENHLCRAQVLVGKHRAGIHRIHRLAATTTMHRYMTTVRVPEKTRLLHARSTLRAVKTMRVKVFPQPYLAQLVGTDIENWKIHIHLPVDRQVAYIPYTRVVNCLQIF